MRRSHSRRRHPPNRPGCSPSGPSSVAARGDADGCEGFVDPALELAGRSGDHGALAAAYTARAMLAALRGDLTANARFYGSPSITPNEPVTWPRSCASAPIGAAGSTNWGNTPRPSPTRPHRSRPPSWPDPTLSALAYTNRGEAYLALGQLDLALADLRRAHDIWTRLASNRILFTRSTTWDSCSFLRGQRSEASPCSTRRSASPPASVTPRGSCRRTSAWPTPSIGTIQKPLPTRPARRSRRTTPCGCRSAYLAAGNVALHSDDLTAATDWAAKATRTRPAAPRPSSSRRSLVAQRQPRQRRFCRARSAGEPVVAGPWQPDRRGTRRSRARPGENRPPP